MCGGRLVAVLSLSVAWLLALECGAASNAASHVAHFRLTSSRGRRLQALRHQARARAFNKPITAKEMVKADVEAQEDFVRRCQVVVTVSDSKFLPVQPLDRFCRTTDAVVECRLKVGQRLKETHARDGDMGKFCSAVYDWFQGKYGMKCPSQCRKLQCKSTCMWLEAKKQLNSDNIKIKDDMLKAEEALKHIKGLAQNLHAKTTAEKKMNFEIKMLATKMGRATKSLEEKKKDHGAAKEKLGKVDTALKKLEKTIASTKENLIKMDDDLMKQKFAIDKAKLKYESMTRSIQRSTDRSKEDRAEQKSLEADAAKVGESMAQVSKAKDELQKTIDNDKTGKEKIEAEIKKKVADLEKACKELVPYQVDNVKAEDSLKDFVPKGHEDMFGRYMNGNYKQVPEVPIIKELVENQYAKVKATEKQLNAIAKKLRDAANEMKALEADNTRLQKDKKKATDAAEAAAAAAKKEEESAKTEGESAAKFKENDITKPTEKHEKAQADRLAMQGSKEKAEKTAKFMVGIVQEQKAKFDAAAGAVSSGQMLVDSLTKDEEKAAADLKVIQKEMEDLDKQAKAAKEKLAADEKTLTEKIKVYKESSTDLEKHKPEIVRLFSLKPEL